MPDIFDTTSLYIVFNILKRKIWLILPRTCVKNVRSYRELLVNALIFLENRVYLYNEVATNPTQVVELF